MAFFLLENLYQRKLIEEISHVWTSKNHLTSQHRRNITQKKIKYYQRNYKLHYMIQDKIEMSGFEKWTIRLEKNF